MCIRDRNTVKRLKDVDDRTSRIGFPQKSEHKTGFYKMNCQQAFPSGFSDDAIHLHDGCLRFFFKKFWEIRITASQTAPPVYFKFWLFVSGTKMCIRDRFMDKLEDMLRFLIPNYIKEGKYQLVVAIGCTGGKHRSVTLANELYRRMKDKGNYGLTISHRDVK